MPKTVYSYRLKEKFDNRSLFKDLEILKYPFLKKGTIQKCIEIIEPWYNQYPKFITEAFFTYEKEGYKYLTISDISSYFENINADLLRDLLLKYLPKEQKIVNLLNSILKYWTWRSLYGYSVERGIPQGNAVSSFLGNIYLLQLDEKFINYANKNDIKYFRYVDDVKIFSKKENVAREVIFIMNKILRQLHLNLQGSKTMIKSGTEIRFELIDERMEEVNNVIDDIQKNLNKISNDQIINYIEKLKNQYKNIKNKTKIIKGKNLRLYLRLLTGFTLLKSSFLIDNLLLQLEKNPDSRLLRKAIIYLKRFPRSAKKIEKKFLEFLESPLNLFFYQEARMLELLRKLRYISKDSIRYAKKALDQKSKNWYIRVQAGLFLSILELKSKYLTKLHKKYHQETNIEILKSIVKCLCQLQEDKLLKFLKNLSFEANSKLANLGCMLINLKDNHNNSADIAITEIFNNFDEEILMEFYYKIDIIKFSEDIEIRKRLLNRLKLNKKTIKRAHLKIKVENTIINLQNSLEKNKDTKD